MTVSRTALRATAVLGATAALTFAGTGIAAATTHDVEVDGNDVTVTFEIESGQVGDLCGGVVTQAAEAAGVAGEFAGAFSEGDLLKVLRSLNNNDSITVLRGDGLLVDPLLVRLGPVTNPTDTVSASDLPSNIYSVVSVCASDPLNPTINPIVLVGGPVEAVMGSIESGSNAGGLGTLSSVLGGGEGAGGLDTLSSVLDGGDGEGGGLGTLSSALVGGDTGDES